jgi:ABC-type sugar transport system ATPase subunit
VFLGPSGCGKTTTLRSIAGLEQAQSGDILIGARRVNNLSPADRDIAFVFQFYALYPHLNVYDNIAFPLRAQKTPAAEVGQRVQNIARILQIEPFLHRRIRQLSSGEQQRVALGRLLMDEPLTNLDATLRVDMRAELKHLQQQNGITTIYVTHDQVEAMALGDRITVMNRGRIQQMGSPMDVYRHPANIFVAGFIGTPPMNLVPCSLRLQDGSLQAVNESFVVPLPSRVVSVLKSRPNLDRVVVGLRPEAVRVSLQRPVGSASAPLAASVYALEPLGDENIVDLRVGSVALRARTAPSLRPSVNDQVWITPVVADMHIFDPESELVIGEAVSSVAPSVQREAVPR